MTFYKIPTKLNALFLIAFLLTGCGLFSNPDKRIFGLFENEPNDLERLYYNLAGALASEKPCFLISTDSYIVAPGTNPFNTSGNVVSLYRSRCFHNVAQLSLRTELCDQIKTASTWIYSGTERNTERCRDDVAARQRVSGNFLDTRPLVEIADLTESEFDKAMLELRIFPDLEVLQAYRAEREDQYLQCASRYVIYSEMFFDKIDDFQNFGGSTDLKQMETI